MADSSKSTRRDILKNSLLTAGVIGAGALGVDASLADPMGANNRVRIGVIGTGVRGKYLIGNLPEATQVVAICDCATSRMAETLEPKGNFVPILQRFKNGDAARCKTYQDYRQMLDREQLDAVIIATPDHHHVQAAMLALQAGLDVYLEKPLTVTINEGRLLANMVKKTGRVLQVGSQQRTMEINRFGCEFVRDGGLGKISKVELSNYPGPIADPQLGSEPIPKGLDWNLFLGPTPTRPHHRKLWVKDDFKVGDLMWRGWDLFRDYSGHLMTNWGAHSVDMVQYALGKDNTGPVEMKVMEPKSVQAIWQDWDHKTPAPITTQDRRFWPVWMRYADGVELHFINGPDSIRFHGEKGTMKMRRNHFEVKPKGLLVNGPDPDIAKKWKGSGHVARPHLENWLECIRSRGVPNAPVEVGHRSITVCHLANIVREVNEPLRWNPKEERFVGNEQANALLERPRRQPFALPT